MKYLFLAYSDEQQWKLRPSNERDTLDKACIANNEALRESGYLLATENLKDSGPVTTVWVTNKTVCLKDGPLFKENEQLVGLFFIHARDLNEAILVASKMPQTHRGLIEVHLIDEEI